MKLIVLLLLALIVYPQSSVEAWPFLKGQIQESHVLPMLIYFSSDQCLKCEKFDALFEQPEMLHQMEQHYVSVRVSIDDTDGRACADIYRIETVPAFVIADHQGVILYKSDASLSVEDIQLLLDHVPGEYSTVKHPEAQIPEDNPSMYAVTSLIENQSFETVSSLSVEEPAVNLQHTESIPVVLTEESKPVQVLPVTTNQQETPVANQKSLITNVSPSPIEATMKTKVIKAPKDENMATAIPKSTSSTVEAATPVMSKPPVRVQRSYSIQLGYFTEAVNSNKLVQRAKAKGLTATRTQTELRDGKSCYRVLIGDFKTLAAAQEQLAEVHALGLKGAVHRQ